MKINKQLYKDVFGWGFLLWLFGYLLGIILFFAVPKSMIGWMITPIATIATLWVLIKKIHGISFSYYFQIAIFWTLIAILLDYFLLVRVLKLKDTYYKADVYLYYALTFILPLLVGVWKRKKTDHASTRQPNQS